MQGRGGKSRVLFPPPYLNTEGGFLREGARVQVDSC